MPPPQAKSLRRAARWLVPAAALALAPKCLLCVVAYAGLGAALGLGGREMCGASDGSFIRAGWLLPVLGLVAVATFSLGTHRLRRIRKPETVSR